MDVRLVVSWAEQLASQRVARWVDSLVELRDESLVDWKDSGRVLQLAVA